MTILSRMTGSSYSPGKSDHSDVTRLLDRGADVQVRDVQGRTLLHHAISGQQGMDAYLPYDEKRVTRLDFMVGLGLDVQAVDYRGNTLVHQFVSRSGMMDSYHGPKLTSLLKKLLDLGINIDQGNQRGRNALHILAATKPANYGRASYKARHSFPLDLAIRKVKNIDQRDHLGLTALHLASTVSEYTTKKLLDAGADPTLATLEGLTPLHLAARARDSNVVGLLLSFIEGPDAMAVNAQDEKGNTPLYYACRSGRPETVQLLLETGADAFQKKFFLACAAFENEERLWYQIRHETDTMMNQSAGGLTIDDVSRPVAIPSNIQQSISFDTLRNTTRLEEILNMLADRGCDPSGLTGSGGTTGALDEAADAGHDYTFGCLLKARDTVSDKQQSTQSIASLFAEQAFRAYRDVQISVAVDFRHLVAGEANQKLVVELLKKRQYHVMSSLYDKGVNFLAEDDYSRRSNLELFVEHGYASLLDEIGRLEAERCLGQGKWHAFGNRKKPGLFTEVNLETGQSENGRHTNLLLTALRRNLPNMDVVRLLVEKFHVDVNQYSYTKTLSDEGKYELVADETALHYLAAGGHWWHVALALPYLISKGAKIDARSSAGCTPLHIALGGPGGYVGPFNKDAAKVLVAAGANLDAHIDKGRSYLACTAGDIEMVKLLMERKAPICADSLFMAIDGMHVDVLKTLLSAGGDANMRLGVTKPPPISRTSRKSRERGTKMELLFGIPAQEVYPLYAAAMKHGIQNSSLSAAEKRQCSHKAVQLVEALLASGADPFATLRTIKPDYGRDVEEETEDETVRALLLEHNFSDEEYEDVTLLHELLEENELVHPILDLATLDANHRDAKGRTVLHVACHIDQGIGAPIDSLLASSDPGVKSTLPSYLDCLLARGADPLATDNEGCNILHHMFQTKNRYRKSEREIHTITRVAKAYLGLVNQANVCGKTPLHLALKHAIWQSDTAPAQALLEVGADPFAVDDDRNGSLHILALHIYQSSSIRSLFTQLMDRNLDINARNNRGETPVFNLNKRTPSPLTRAFKKEEVVSATEALLLFEKAGADIFVRDKEGKGLLHIAAKEAEEPNKDVHFTGLCGDEQSAESCTARFEVLMKRGLDPLIEDSQKRTALDIAVACGKESILKLFKKDVFGAE